MTAAPEQRAHPGPPDAEAPPSALPVGSEAAQAQAGRRAVFAREAARKLVHATTATLAAILAWALPDGERRGLFVAVAAFALLVDVARLTLPALGRHFQRALGPMLRGQELRRISGATTLAFGFMAAVVLFPRPAAVAGLLFGGLADAAGALVGRPLGRHRYPGGKSLEGSAAFLATAFVIGWALPSLGLLGALAVALVLTLIEALPLPFDDNLLVPLAGAALTFFACRLA